MHLKYQSNKGKYCRGSVIKKENIILELTALGKLFEELSETIEKSETRATEIHLSRELQILGELSDELIQIRKFKRTYCCKARNLLHCIQGLFELKGKDVGFCIETMVDILETGITELNWERLNEYVLDLYRTAFLISI